MNKNIMIGVLVVVLGIVGFVGYQQNEEKIVYKTQLENTYQYNFQSLLSSVKNIETTMSKATVSVSSSLETELLSDVWRQADIAQIHLSRLPLEQTTLKDTQAFLNKLSDFSYTMAKINMNGKQLSQDQQNDIERLKNSSSYLLQQLQVMNEQVQAGEVKFSTESKQKAENNLDKASENLVTKGFTAVQKELVEYPKLIYDGPFSDHIQDTKALWVKGEKITEKEGEAKVREFLGENSIVSIKSNGKNKGVIKSYVYDVDLKDQEEDAYIEISENGGHVLKVMKNRIPTEQKLSVEEAQKKADEFLKDKGYENLVNTYHEKYSNAEVFNYAYTQDDVVIYSDLIKVQIALDTGEMLGVEAQGFHMAHHEREIKKPTISAKDAKNNLSNKLEITRERLAIIPTEFNTEVLCYEFKGTYKDEWFIVYINAETGKEQQILKIIEADESVLTL